MTEDPDTPSTPTTPTSWPGAEETARWRRWAGLAPLLVFAAAIAWNAVAWAVDLSPLRQATYSWGYSFAAVMYTLFAAPVFLVALGLGVAGVSARQHTTLAAVATAGAVLDALVGAALLVAAVALYWTEPLAGQVFSVLTAMIGLGLLVPLWKVQSLRNRT